MSELADRKKSIKQLILQYINDKYPDLVTVKELKIMLRRKYKISISTDDIYVYVSRLYKPRKGEPQIRKAGRGLYQANTKLENLYKLEEPPVELHGIKIECQIDKSHLQNGMQIITFLQLQNFKQTTNGRWTGTEVFDGRKVTFTFHVENKRMGFIEIWINASNNPLDVMAFDKMITTIFDGYLRPLGVITDRRVVQSDVARDFMRLRLDGVQCIRLRSFLNGWLKVYYHHKRHATRFEVRLTSNISLDEAIKTLFELTRRNYLMEEIPELKRKEGIEVQ